MQIHRCSQNKCIMPVENDCCVYPKKEQLFQTEALHKKNQGNYG